MNIDNAEIGRQSLVDSMESEDARRLQVASCIEIPVLIQGSARHKASGNTPVLRGVTQASCDRLDNEPLPDQIGRSVAVTRIILRSEERRVGKERRERG